MSDDIQFQNMDSWKGSGSGKFGLTFKQIVLMHINRCVVNGSVEWHGGYWNETGYNPTVKTYMPNSRDVYCNSIKMLRALLLGYFDKTMKERDIELQKELKELHGTFIKQTKENNTKFLKAEYYEDKVALHLRVFEELIMLSKRLNFFEAEETEDII